MHVLALGPNKSHGNDLRSANLAGPKISQFAIASLNFSPVTFTLAANVGKLIHPSLCRANRVVLRKAFKGIMDPALISHHNPDRWNVSHRVSNERRLYVTPAPQQIARAKLIE
jgi:hypothetical protein